MYAHISRKESIFRDNMKVIFSCLSRIYTTAKRHDRPIILNDKRKIKQ